MITTVTKLSTKGQVVIPLVIRKKWKLKPGDCFTVVLAGEMIALRKIKENGKV